MPAFFVHFELLETSPEEESSLNATLAERGFASTVTGSNKIQYRLPKYVYYFNGTKSSGEVLDDVQRLGSSTRKRYTVFVVEVANSAWAGLDVLGRDPQARGGRRDMNPGSLTSST
jgi:hypothetical protein